ncbi:MAG: SUMF1/EgtB/PvdO family nonheme iron enzyme [Spirochaetota bacterium]
MTLLLLVFSCATAPPPEEADQQDQDADVAAPEAPESETDETDEPQIVEPDPTPEVESEPVTIQLVNPTDPTTITRSSFLLSAVPSEGSLAALEIELLDGPVLAGEDDPRFRVDQLASLPVERRRYEIAYDGDALLVSLPPGFVDGARYDVRIRGVLADGRTSEWVTSTTTLDLGLEPPSLETPPPTIDTTPVVQVEAATPVQLIINGLPSFERAAGGRLEFPVELQAGRYRVQARTISADGFLTRPGAERELIVRADARPAVAWPTTGETTLSTRVGLHWTSVEGGVGYQARYRASGDESWQQIAPTGELFTAIPELLNPAASYEWQVRTQNDAGTWFSWSGPVSFAVGSFALDFATIVRPGGSATFTRGYAAGSRDEQPVREILLTEPYEMAVTPLTNRELVTLVEFAAARGMVVVDASGVWTIEEPRRSLLGLGAMDYGEQFGLIYDDGLVRPRPGYEDHPAVGITWQGAIAVANLLSYAEGRPPAYDGEGNRTGSTSAFRLPTEAEWEYAARGTTERILPWGGSLSGRVSNYYRSFDPFEDVNEPFTGNGGPTNPVGFFDGSIRSGFQTASDASPFGLRDMVGNVWEWCFDRYDPGYYAQSPDADPAGPAAADLEQNGGAVVLAVALDPNQRVVRGAAWNSRAPDVRLTNRGRYTELGRSYSIGLRLVRGLGVSNSGGQ